MNKNKQKANQEISKKIEELTATHTSRKNRTIEELQAEMLEFNKSLPRNAGDNNRTIAQEEDIIIQKFGGKKLDIEDFHERLSEFVFDGGDMEYLKSLSPCKIIFQLTEEVIPEEYFYSFYLITLAQDPNYTKPYDNQVIVYITSKDGVNVYIASLLRNHIIRDKLFDKKISSEICYYEDGIAVYPNEIEKGTGF
ncbi:MAG: hypothetical protein IJX30_01160 [Clostridia bacterium]|nr:hypothetical protein [Clostridia bacterium]